MGNRSVFPEQIDTFVEHVELSPADMQDAMRWNTLKAKTNRTLAEENEYALLSDKLSAKIFSAEDLNKYQDALLNLQNFFKNEVEGRLSEQAEVAIDEITGQTTTSIDQIVSVTEQIITHGKAVLSQIINTVTVSGDSSVSNIAVGLPQYNPVADVLYVFQDGVKLIQGVDYSIDSAGSTITLAEPVTSAVFEFILYKNTLTTLAMQDGYLIDPNSVPEDRLVETARFSYRRFVVNGVILDMGAWVREESGGYTYRLESADILEGNTVDIEFASEEDLALATEAQIHNISYEGIGYVDIYANYPPTANITVNLVIWRD